MTGFLKISHDSAKKAASLMANAAVDSKNHIQNFQEKINRNEVKKMHHRKGQEGITAETNLLQEVANSNLMETKGASINRQGDLIRTNRVMEMKAANHSVKEQAVIKNLTENFL